MTRLCSLAAAVGFFVTSQAAAQTPQALQAVAIGPLQACALLQDGRAACWHWADVAVDALGELLVSSYTPPALPPLRAVAVGNAHACGVGRDDASVWCWGSNTLGQLGTRGDGGVRATRVPADLPFVDVTAGRDHTCALTRDARAWCWGDQWEGSTGTLPTGETVRDPSPVRGSRRFTQLSAGDRHTCGVTTAGYPACWGDNSTGAIRADNWRTFFSPVDVRGVGKVRAVHSGSGRSCGILEEGTAVCWGSGAEGTPAGADRTFLQLALAEEIVCGMRPTGQVDCWGAPAGDEGPREMRFAGQPIRATSLSGAGAWVCANTDGGLLCWEASDVTMVRRMRVIAN